MRKTATPGNQSRQGALQQGRGHTEEDFNLLESRKESVLSIFKACESVSPQLSTESKKKLAKVFLGENFREYREQGIGIIKSAKNAEEVARLADSLEFADNLFKARSKGLTLRDQAVLEEVKKVLNHPELKNQELADASKSLSSKDALLVHCLVQDAHKEESGINIVDPYSMDGKIERDGGPEKKPLREDIAEYRQSITALLYTSEREGMSFDMDGPDKGQVSTSSLAGTIANSIKISRESEKEGAPVSPTDVYYAAMTVGGKVYADSERFYYAGGSDRNICMGPDRRGEDIVPYAHEFAEQPSTAIHYRPQHVKEIAGRARRHIQKAVESQPEPSHNPDFPGMIIQRMTPDLIDQDLGMEIGRLENDLTRMAAGDDERRMKQAETVHKAYQKNKDKIRMPRDRIVPPQY